MTDKLYYRDPTVAFEATVVGYAGDPFRVLLDRTAFYPTSGGQPHDTGRLGVARVLDVIDGADGVIHIVDAPIPLGPVRGEIDADRRHDLTVQHTAQHLLSALGADQFGWDTASVHFGMQHSTIEFSAASISTDELRTLEAMANQAVAESRSVTISFEPADVATRTGLRKPTEREGNIRVISIDGLDRSACGGTHVGRTSELGSIAITGSERVRAHVRIEFLAGTRVLHRLRELQGALATVAAEADCAPGDLAALVRNRFAEARDLHARLTLMEDEVARARVNDLRAAVTPGADGLHRILHRRGDESASMLRQMAQGAAERAATLWVAIDGSASMVYFSASADAGIDAGAELKARLVANGGRGGGSPRVAQGTTPTLDAAERIAAELLQVKR